MRRTSTHEVSKLQHATASVSYSVPQLTQKFQTQNITSIYIYIYTIPLKWLEAALVTHLLHRNT